MALIPAKCTECGASIKVDSDKEAGICEYCGTPFITEKAINNFNVSGNINIENATVNVPGADIDNLLARAQQYEALGDKEKAREYYNRVLDIDANNEIAKSKAFVSRFYIGQTIVSEDVIANIDAMRLTEKLPAIKLCREVSGMTLAEAKYFVEHFDEIDKSVPQVASDAGPIATKKSGCYIATCVYGSYDCPEVWTLRRYRDNSLASSKPGRAFIRVYYATSPTIVKIFGKTECFKRLWRKILDKKVKSLRENGYEDTPYNDR